MSNSQGQTTEFENDYFMVIDKSVIDLSQVFDDLFNEKKGHNILNTIETAVSMLSEDYNIPSKMQISYNIASAYCDLRVIEQIDNDNYLEKEIYYFRNTLDIYESNFYDEDDEKNAERRIARYIAMRSYTNLGNTMRALGRYIAAIDSFENALLINNNFAMASLNLSSLLFCYAQLQIKPYEQCYYHHACFYYYQRTEECKVNLENPKYLDDLQELIALFDSEYVENYLKKPLTLPDFRMSNVEEQDYRNYICIFRLFLDPCLDILSDPCFEVDSINLPFDEPYDNKEIEFIGLFNQIKQEYNWARYLWYKTSTDETYECYADKELGLVDTGEFSDYSLKESMLRTAFKTAYSLFDRIGFFINEYFQVGLTNTKVSFKNVWKNKLADRNGQVYFTVPNPIISTHADNPLIRAMYWLQKDFYENKKINVTTPHAEPIFQMRNDMEHNCLRTGKPSNDASFTKYTTEGEIENNTYRLLKLARELIIYLCLAVAFDKRKENWELDS